MPGCGKTTFGRKVAREMGLEFFDLDKEIMEREQRPITDIFEIEGEGYFRKIESRLLREVSLNNDDFIMATGGGAPCFHDNMDFMNENGHTIYIDTPIDMLIERLSLRGIEKRPLIKKMGTENMQSGLKNKLNNRLPYYRKANITFKYNIALETDIINYLRNRNQA
jgi:shikimate kinase